MFIPLALAMLDPVLEAYKRSFSKNHILCGISIVYPALAWEGPSAPLHLQRLLSRVERLILEPLRTRRVLQPGGLPLGVDATDLCSEPPRGKLFHLGVGNTQHAPWDSAGVNPSIIQSEPPVSEVP